MGGGIGNVWGSDEKRVLDCSMKEMFDVERKFFCSGLCRGTFLILAAMFLLAGCGDSGKDLFDKTVPQNSKRDFMFVVTEWQCEYCGEIIVQSSYGNGDAYGYPPLKDCKRNPGFAHSYTMTRWKSYDWDYTANTWKYGRGEDRRNRKQETKPGKSDGLPAY